jgi:shikimate kinase
MAFERGPRPPGRFSKLMLLKLKRTPGIYLVGFMGCGKSTVGRALADHIGWNFIDLDEEIERAQGAAIPEIFEQKGEAAFREIEAAALRERVKLVDRGRPFVIALGGGAFLSDDNVKTLTRSGVTIWLDCPLDTVERRVAGFEHRPLARDPEMFRELYESRRASYSRAEYRVEVNGDDAEATVRDIMALSLL